MIVYEHKQIAAPDVVTITKVEIVGTRMYIDYLVPCFGSFPPADLCVIFALDDVIVRVDHYNYKELYCLLWGPRGRAVLNIPENKTEVRLRVAWNTVCCPWVHSGVRWRDDWLGGEQGTPGRAGYRIYGCIGKVIFDRVIKIPQFVEITNVRFNDGKIYADVKSSSTTVVCLYIREGKLCKVVDKKFVKSGTISFDVSKSGYYCVSTFRGNVVSCKEVE